MWIVDEKNTHGGERAKHVGFSDICFTPSQLKKGGRDLLSEAGSVRKHQLRHRLLGTREPSWPSTLLLF